MDFVDSILILILSIGPLVDCADAFRPSACIASGTGAIAALPREVIRQGHKNRQRKTGMMGPAAQLSYDSVRPGHLLQALPDVVEWPSTAGDSEEEEEEEDNAESPFVLWADHEIGKKHRKAVRRQQVSEKIPAPPEGFGKRTYEKGIDEDPPDDMQADRDSISQVEAIYCKFCQMWLNGPTQQGGQITKSARSTKRLSGSFLGSDNGIVVRYGWKPQLPYAAYAVPGPPPPPYDSASASNMDLQLQ
ncbi:hypothetical protein AK812_SmicGene31578 [Symbiodinium microadriaticum]|uniref:Uncharacterized protein n=1 Tax=Symbiodinium microadriaticum TaxID=2951 RepID=A0A1Q9CWB3_SYMMI|nr:hypothetical protein AK812_SmicGene31578 [Symbiodinium microadriaticum]